MDYSFELNKLRKELKSSYAWLTLGEEATIGLKQNETQVSSPSLESQVLDTIGAGDGFLFSGFLGRGVRDRPPTSNVHGAVGRSFGSKDPREQGVHTKKPISQGWDDSPQFLAHG